MSDANPPQKQQDAAEVIAEGKVDLPLAEMPPGFEEVGRLFEPLCNKEEVDCHLTYIHELMYVSKYARTLGAYATALHFIMNLPESSDRMLVLFHALPILWHALECPGYERYPITWIPPKQGIFFFDENGEF